MFDRKFFKFTLIVQLGFLSSFFSSCAKQCGDADWFSFSAASTYGCEGNGGELIGSDGNGYKSQKANQLSFHINQQGTGTSSSGAYSFIGLDVQDGVVAVGSSLLLARGVVLIIDQWVDGDTDLDLATEIPSPDEPDDPLEDPMSRFGENILLFKNGTRMVVVDSQFDGRGRIYEFEKVQDSWNFVLHRDPPQFITDAYGFGLNLQAKDDDYYYVGYILNSKVHLFRFGDGADIDSFELGDYNHTFSAMSYYQNELLVTELGLMQICDVSDVHSSPDCYFENDPFDISDPNPDLQIHLFGSSVALTNNYAFVGAPGSYLGQEEMHEGVVLIYRRQFGRWDYHSYLNDTYFEAGSTFRFGIHIKVDAAHQLLFITSYGIDQPDQLFVYQWDNAGNFVLIQNFDKSTNELFAIDSINSSIIRGYESVLQLYHLEEYESETNEIPEYIRDFIPKRPVQNFEPDTTEFDDSNKGKSGSEKNDDN